MELHQLRYFLSVAETGNFTRAAERCHVAQASLSQQIIKLEDELESALFERLRRRAVLTPAGQTLKIRAERILEDVRLAELEVRQLTGEPGGRLTLGALPTIAPYFLPSLIEKLQDRLPQIEPHLQEDTTARLVEAISRNEIELAIVSDPVPGPQLTRIELFQEPLWLALPPSSPLSKKRNLSWKDLINEPFILMQDGHCLGQQTLKFCYDRNFQPNVVCRSAQIETVLALIRNRVGISLIPDMAKPKGRQSGLVFRRLERPTPFRSIVAVSRNQRTLSQAAQATVDLLMTLSKAKTAEHKDT